MVGMPHARFQFRLSTLLWITLAVACWFGGREYRRREMAFGPIKYLKFFGNTIKKRTLEKKVDLIRVGDPLNAAAVSEAKAKLLEYYQEKGYFRAKIEIIEGNKPNDRGVKFVIDQGPKIRTDP